MESKKVFPLKDRLDSLQINELEGYRDFYSGGHTSPLRESLITVSKNELLLKYHRALEVAEKELEKYAHVDDGLRIIRNTLDKYFPDE